jgi:hypothetical protein
VRSDAGMRKVEPGSLLTWTEHRSMFGKERFLTPDGIERDMRFTLTEIHGSTMKEQSCVHALRNMRKVDGSTFCGFTS